MRAVDFLKGSVIIKEASASDQLAAIEHAAALIRQHGYTSVDDVMMFLEKSFPNMTSTELKAVLKHRDLRGHLDPTRVEKILKYLDKMIPGGAKMAKVMPYIISAGLVVYGAKKAYDAAKQAASDASDAVSGWAHNISDTASGLAHDATNVASSAISTAGTAASNAANTASNLATTGNSSSVATYSQGTRKKPSEKLKKMAKELEQRSDRDSDPEIKELLDRYYKSYGKD